MSTSDLKLKLDVQEKTIVDLKKLVAEKEQHLHNKDDEIKEQKVKFAKRNLQLKSRMSSLQKDIEKMKESSGGDTPQKASEVKVPEGLASDSLAQGKISILKRKINDLEDHLTEKQKELDRIRRGVSDNEEGQGDDKEDQEVEMETADELYAHVMHKDQRLLELNEVITGLEARILDLNEALCEKDEVIRSKTLAVQVYQQSAREHGELLQTHQQTIHSLTSKLAAYEEKVALVTEQVQKSHLQAFDAMQGGPDEREAYLIALIQQRDDYIAQMQAYLHQSSRPSSAMSHHSIDQIEELVIDEAKSRTSSTSSHSKARADTVLDIPVDVVPIEDAAIDVGCQATVRGSENLSLTTSEGDYFSIDSDDAVERTEVTVTKSGIFYNPVGEEEPFAEDTDMLKRVLEIDEMCRRVDDFTALIQTSLDDCKKKSDGISNAKALATSFHDQLSATSFRSDAKKADTFSIRQQYGDLNARLKDLKRKDDVICHKFVVQQAVIHQLLNSWKKVGEELVCEEDMSSDTANLKVHVSRGKESINAIVCKLQAFVRKGASRRERLESMVSGALNFDTIAQQLGEQEDNLVALPGDLQLRPFAVEMRNQVHAILSLLKRNLARRKASEVLKGQLDATALKELQFETEHLKTRLSEVELQNTVLKELLENRETELEVNKGKTGAMVETNEQLAGQMNILLSANHQQITASDDASARLSSMGKTLEEASALSATNTGTRKITTETLQYLKNGLLQTLQRRKALVGENLNLEAKVELLKQENARLTSSASLVDGGKDRLLLLSKAKKLQALVKSKHLTVKRLEKEVKELRGVLLNNDQLLEAYSSANLNLICALDELSNQRPNNSGIQMIYSHVSEKVHLIQRRLRSRIKEVATLKQDVANEHIEQHIESIQVLEVATPLESPVVPPITEFDVSDRKETTLMKTGPPQMIFIRHQQPSKFLNDLTRTSGELQKLAATSEVLLKHQEEEIASILTTSGNHRSSISEFHAVMQYLADHLSGSIRDRLLQKAHLIHQLEGRVIETENRMNQMNRHLVELNSVGDAHEDHTQLLIQRNNELEELVRKQKTEMAELDEDYGKIVAQLQEAIQSLQLKEEVLRQSQGDCSAFQEKCNDLTSLLEMKVLKVDELTNELDHSHQGNDRLQSRLHEAEEYTAESEATVKQLQDEFVALKEKVKELQSAVALKDETITRLQEQIESLCKSEALESEARQDELQRFSNELIQKNMELDQFRENHDLLSANFTSLAKDNEDKDAKIEQLSKKVVLLHNKLKHYAASSGSLETSLPELVCRIANTIQRCEDTDDVLTALVSNCQKNAQQISELREINQTTLLKSDRVSLLHHKRCEKLKATQDGFNTLLNRKDAEIGALQDVLCNTETKLKDEMDVKEMLVNLRADESERLAATLLDNDRMLSALEDKDNRIAELETDENNFELSIREAGTSLIEAQLMLKDAKTDYNDVKAELESLREQVAVKDDDIAELQAALQANNDKTDKLKHQLELREEQIQRLTQEFASSTDSASEAMENEVTELTKQLDDTMAALVKMKEQYQNEKGKVVKVTKQLRLKAATTVKLASLIKTLKPALQKSVEQNDHLMRQVDGSEALLLELLQRDRNAGKLTADVDLVKSQLKNIMVSRRRAVIPIEEEVLVAQTAPKTKVSPEEDSRLPQMKSLRSKLDQKEKELTLERNRNMALTKKIRHKMTSAGKMVVLVKELRQENGKMKVLLGNIEDKVARQDESYNELVNDIAMNKELVGVTKPLMSILSTNLLRKLSSKSILLKEARNDTAVAYHQLEEQTALAKSLKDQVIHLNGALNNAQVSQDHTSQNMVILNNIQSMVNDVDGLQSDDIEAAVSMLIEDHSAYKSNSVVLNDEIENLRSVVNAQKEQLAIMSQSSMEREKRIAVLSDTSFSDHITGPLATLDQNSEMLEETLVQLSSLKSRFINVIANKTIRPSAEFESLGAELFEKERQVNALTQHNANVRSLINFQNHALLTSGNVSNRTEVALEEISLQCSDSKSKCGILQTQLSEVMMQTGKVLSKARDRHNQLRSDIDLLKAAVLDKDRSLAESLERSEALARQVALLQRTCADNGRVQQQFAVFLDRSKSVTVSDGDGTVSDCLELLSKNSLEIKKMRAHNECFVERFRSLLLRNRARRIPLPKSPLIIDPDETSSLDGSIVSIGSVDQEISTQITDLQSRLKSSNTVLSDIKSTIGPFSPEKPVTENQLSDLKALLETQRALVKQHEDGILDRDSQIKKYLTIIRKLKAKVDSFERKKKQEQKAAVVEAGQVIKEVPPAQVGEQEVKHSVTPLGTSVVLPVMESGEFQSLRAKYSDVQMELESLSQRHSILENDLRIAIEQRDEVSNELVKKRSACDILQDEFTQLRSVSSAQSGELSGQVSQLERACAEMSAQLEIKQSEIASWREKCTDVSEKFETNEEQLYKIRDELAEKSMLADSLKSQMDSLVSVQLELDNSSIENDQLVKDLATAKAEINDLNAEISVDQENKVKYQQEFHALTELNVLLESQLRNLKLTSERDLSDANARINQLERDWQEAQADAIDNSEAYKNAEAKVQDLNKLIEALQLSLEDEKDSKAELKSLNSSVVETTEQLENEVADLNRQLLDVSQKLDSSLAEVEHLKRALDDAEESKNRVLEGKASLIEEIDDLRHQLTGTEQLEASNHSLNAYIENLEEENKSMLASIEDLQGDRTKREHLESKILELEDVIKNNAVGYEQFQSESYNIIQKLSTNNAELQGHNGNLEQSLQEAAVELETGKEKLEKLEKALSESADAISSLREENKELFDQVRELEEKSEQVEVLRQDRNLAQITELELNDLKSVLLDKDELVDKLKSECSTLKDSLSERANQNDVVEKQNDAIGKMKLKNLDLVTKLEAAELRLKDVFEVNDDLKSKVAALREELQATSLEKESFSQSALAKQSSKDDLQHEVDNLKASLSSCEGKLELLKDDNSQLLEQLAFTDDNDAIVNEFKIRTDLLGVENEKLKESMDAAIRDRDSLQAETETLGRKYFELENSARQLEDLSDDIGRLKSSSKQTEQLNISLQEQCDVLSAENMKLRSKKSGDTELHGKTKELQASKEALENQLKELRQNHEAKLQDLKEQLEVALQERQVLQDNLDAITRELSAFDAAPPQLITMTENVQLVKSSAPATATTVDGLALHKSEPVQIYRIDGSSLKEKLQHLGAENKRMAGRLGIVENEKTGLQKEVDQLYATNASLSHQTERAISESIQLKQQIERITSHLHDAKTLHSSELQRLSNEVQTLSQNNFALTTQLEAALLDNGPLKQENDALVQDIACLKSSNDGLVEQMAELRANLQPRGSVANIFEETQTSVDFAQHVGHLRLESTRMEQSGVAESLLDTTSFVESNLSFIDAVYEKVVKMVDVLLKSSRADFAVCQDVRTTLDVRLSELLRFKFDDQGDSLLRLDDLESKLRFHLSEIHSKDSADDRMKEVRLAVGSHSVPVGVERTFASYPITRYLPDRIGTLHKWLHRNMTVIRRPCKTRPDCWRTAAFIYMIFVHLLVFSCYTGVV